MKTTHICPSYKPAYIYGGPTMSVSKLCEGLAQAGCNTELLTTTANGKTTLKVPTNRPVWLDGVLVYYFKCFSNAPLHFSPALLWHLLFKKDVKLLHLHSWWNSAIILACIVAKMKKIPVLLSPRGMLTPYTLENRNKVFKSLIHQLIGNRLLEYCHIHASTEKEKQDMLSFIKPKSVTVIPNLVRLPEVPSNYIPVQLLKSDANRAIKLVFLSRIEEKKGLGILFAALAKADFKWKLLIAGTGETKYLKRLKNLAAHLGITSSLSWLGQVQDEDKFQLLAGQDLMVLPSHNESFANVVVESLLVGTPVVISDQVGLADYVSAKNMGWISKLTVDDLNHALSEARGSQQQRDRIRKQAPEIIKTDFSDQNLIVQYLRLYKSIGKNG